MLHKDVTILEKVQRRATKILPNTKDLQYVDRLKHLDLPTLAYRRVCGDLNQVYKIVHGLNDISQESLFKFAKQDAGTRGHSYKIQKQHSRLRVREHSFSNRITNLWNSLPDYVVNAKSMNQFKNGVDDALSKSLDKFTYGTGQLWQNTIN